MRPSPKLSVFRLVLLAALVLVAGQAGITSNVARADDLGKTSRADRTVARLVARLMQRDHLSARPLDDSISERAFANFIKTLDPAKVYFLKTDIEEFAAKWKNQFDDQIKSGQYEAAFEIFRRLLERIDARVDDVTRLVEAEHDFSIDEEIVTDSDLYDYPADEAEARERWRKRIKYNLLVFKTDKDTKADPREKLKKRYQAFAHRMHQTDADDVVEMFITAVTTSYDPHTTYFSRSTFENFLIAMSLQLEGIGATLQADDDGYTVIKRIVPGGAADRQGDLEVEDKIVAVGQGEDGEFVDVIGMKLDDVVQKIRGKAGTIVRLKVLNEDETETKTIAIVREKIKLEDSAARGVVFEEGTKANGEPYKIGVIDLPSFYADMGNTNPGSADIKSTTVDVARILGEFKEQHVDSVVLDLRRNGGGSLREAIDCTGLFIDTGTVVQVKDAYGQIQRHNDERRGMSWDGPLVVLTSKFSASASEILAGAVQDYHRGLIVGDSTTHGKGTVQSLIDLNRAVFGVADAPNMYGALKITMQQFYRPNGESTQMRGVVADIVLPSLTDKMDVSESDLDWALPWDSVPASLAENYGQVTPKLLQELRENSAKRLSDDQDFQRELEKIKAYVEQKESKRVSLNEEKFMARRAKLNAEKEDEKTFEDQANHSNLEIERDYYLDEVFRITVDYMQALKHGQTRDN